MEMLLDVHGCPATLWPLIPYLNYPWLWGMIVFKNPQIVNSAPVRPKLP